MMQCRPSTVKSNRSYPCHAVGAVAGGGANGRPVRRTAQPPSATTASAHTQTALDSPRLPYPTCGRRLRVMSRRSPKVRNAGGCCLNPARESDELPSNRALGCSRPSDCGYLVRHRLAALPSKAQRAVVRLLRDCNGCPAQRDTEKKKPPRSPHPALLAVASVEPNGDPRQKGAEFSLCSQLRRNCPP